MSYCAAQNGGVLTASYDMGKGVQSVDEPRYGVDDGRYHVARFRRHGANASLQLDNHSPRSITPSGIHVNGPSVTESRITVIALGGETICPPPLMAVRLAADLRPSADGSAVSTSLVAAQLQAASADSLGSCATQPACYSLGGIA